MADLTDVRWNDEARDKILTDSDRVLQEAVRDAAAAHSGESWEEAYKAINDAVKDRFIDYEPGPDVRKYAEAIERGEYS
ncbi:MULTISPECIES: hypothetical protein [unclassified Frigoribacterium]|uniref:hypothetical protein n=1 Tax=unclassified Frigoribacterium TaxID=2627005 RepID=UPI0006F25CEB|nr:MULTISPECIES: hypothetical protein [unclassified Frigoribacterium]KQO81910.1 hypothetical protein ASF17_12540 [Frigoribacterium sp. Leaf263]KQR66259.1 hypothetical protein ASF89_03805 [Frigoribacterium sp. Leaf172]